MKKLFVAIFMMFSLLTPETDSVRYPTFKVDGTMKNKFEYASETGSSRFSVRNSRMGVRGYLTPFFSYRGQIELSDNGNFKVLDLYVLLNPSGDCLFLWGRLVFQFLILTLFRQPT
ncbi:MAG TPA: hypothetical protein PKC47_04685 [Petrimonas sp.]|nr:hypothetical protein [Petrimonas sp.]